MTLQSRSLADEVLELDAPAVTWDRLVSLDDGHPARPLDLPSLVRRTSDLLRDGVPLTLLLDLADPHGPDSAARYGREGGDLSWLHAS